MHEKIALRATTSSKVCGKVRIARINRILLNKFYWLANRIILWHSNRAALERYLRKKIDCYDTRDFHKDDTILDELTCAKNLHGLRFIVIFDYSDFIIKEMKKKNDNSKFETLSGKDLENLKKIIRFIARSWSRISPTSYGILRVSVDRSVVEKKR